ncbi:MAG: serine/threonine protein kinase [Thaumarchaeota archaeon]|nr:serine/threonine protein kinase [Nitrososphaerota archaeon]
MNYDVLGTINQGGFGKVYRVRGDDGVIYAMKELKNPNTVNKQRFEREIGILSQLRHPNIVQIIESNTEGNPPTYGPWYTMEFLSGGSLRDHMTEMFRTNLFSRKWALNTVILPVCNALETAHNSGIFHRDLKPENIMYTGSNRTGVKVTDWGLGKDPNRQSIALTQIAGIGGTPGYCAPEQWFSLDTIDGRADIYSLGVILYEMMTGRRPSAYDNFMRRPPVAPPSSFHSTVSQQLNYCILRMIELQPSSRYQSVWELTSTIRSLPDLYS